MRAGIVEAPCFVQRVTTDGHPRRVAGRGERLRGVGASEHDVGKPVDRTRTCRLTVDLLRVICSIDADISLIVFGRDAETHCEFALSDPELFAHQTHLASEHGRCTASLVVSLFGMNGQCHRPREM